MGDGWAGALCLPAPDGAGGQAAESWALRNSKTRPGELVAIQGVGGLGPLGIQFARRMVFESRPLPDEEIARAGFEQEGTERTET